MIDGTLVAFDEDAERVAAAGQCRRDERTIVEM